MKLIQIEYFFELAESGSFRKTAEKLYVSQPAVSKQISLLEKEWGFPLFDRGYRSAVLTPAGKLMYDSLKSMENTFEKSILEAKKESRKIKASLTIGIPEHAELDNFVDIVQTYQREHPEIHVKLQYAGLGQLIPEYPDGKFDVAMNYERNLVSNRMLETERLARRRHVMVVSKHHPLIQQGATSIEAFSGERLYVPSPEGNTLSVDYAAFICANHGVMPGEVVTLPNIDSVLLALKMSFGFAVLDDMVTLPEWFDLIRLPTNVDLDVLLAYHRDNKKACVVDFIEYAKSHLIVESSADNME